MGTDYSIASLETFQFIDLHKWPIIEDVANCLIDGYGAVHEPYKGYQFEIKKEICSSPIVSVEVADVIAALVNMQGMKENHDYINRLIPVVRKFVSDSKVHQFFMTCDLGPEPWAFGEKDWYKWKEIITVFDFHSPFLPRNLIEDYNFSTWDEVLEFYAQKESWMLHEQLKDELYEIRSHFLDLLEIKKDIIK